MSLSVLRRTRKVLFLDRDDTIIKDCGYLNDPNRVEILDGLIQALKIFRDSGFQFIVTTNQSGLTRNLVQIKNLNLIHNKIQKVFNKNGLRILDFYSSPYMHNHKRRKPNWGLCKEAMFDYGIDIGQSVFVGDKWRDLHAGFELGAKTILVNEALDQKKYFKKLKPNLILRDWSQFNSRVFTLFLNNSIQNLASDVNFKDSSQAYRRPKSIFVHSFKNR